MIVTVLMGISSKVNPRMPQHAEEGASEFALSRFMAR
jgi:hypothetical protein